jgi:hypothetical protein
VYLERLIFCQTLVLLVILVVCQTAPLYDRYNDDDDNKFESLTGEQLAGLDEYLADRLSDESASENLSRNTRRPTENSMSKRDALWTTTEVLDCVRRLKMYKNSSKLDLVTEMLNCYRRLKHHG